MRNRLIVYLILCASLMFIQASCKTSNVGGSPDCPKKSVEELQQVLRQEPHKDFEFFSSKVNVSVEDSKSSRSFNASLYMKPDSAFSGLVKLMGIIGATFLIDQDSFAFSNKIEKCYKRESFQSLTELFGTEITYNFAQQMILGLAVGVENIDELYPLKSENEYVLSNYDRKVVERMENSNLSDEEQGFIFFKYTINCETMHLKMIEINVPKDSVYVRIDYLEREMIETFLVPKETKIKIVSPDDSVFIDLSYGNTALNDFKEIRFSVPNSYNVCE